MLYFWVTDFVARKLVIDQCLVKKQPAKTETFKVGKQFPVFRTVQTCDWSNIHHVFLKFSL